MWVMIEGGASLGCKCNPVVRYQPIFTVIYEVCTSADSAEIMSSAKPSKVQNGCQLRLTHSVNVFLLIIILNGSSRRKINKYHYLNQGIGQEFLV